MYNVIKKLENENNENVDLEAKKAEALAFWQVFNKPK